LSISSRRYFSLKESMMGIQPAHAPNIHQFIHTVPKTNKVPCNQENL
jgi:hypothetical protein